MLVRGFSLSRNSFRPVWGTRNSFRGTICAAKLWGNAEGRQAVSAFKTAYKNPLRYLEGILVREKEQNRRQDPLKFR